MKQATAGQILLSEILPGDVYTPGQKLDKKGISGLLAQVAEKYPDKYEEISYKLVRLGLHVGESFGGASFSIDDLSTAKSAKVRADRIRIKMRKLYDRYEGPELREKVIELLSKEAEAQPDEILDESIRDGNKFALQLNGAGRGNKGSLSSMRGGSVMVADASGNPVPIPITRGYSQGVTPAQYFALSYGARKGLVTTKIGVMDGGSLSKMIQQAGHRLMVTDDDDESPIGKMRGLPVSVEDESNVGALLAKDYEGVPRNTVITPKLLSMLKQKGHEELLVRSPIASSHAAGGVYAKDVGIRENGRFASVGDHVGQSASQAIGEQVAQTALCLAEGTMVRMADGSVKPIEKIEVGDMVMGASRIGDTFPVRVLNVFDNGRKMCQQYKFQSTDWSWGATMISTLDHKVLAYDEMAESVEVLPVGCIQTPYFIRYSEFKDGKQQDPKTGAIASSSTVGMEQTWDIEVDHEDHLFVLENGLIVSNSAKHTGGRIGGSDDTPGLQGFELAEKLTNLSENHRGFSTHAEVDGPVKSITPAAQGGVYVHIGDEKHYIAPEFKPTVKPGQMVEAGDVLSNGVPNPAKTLIHKGIGEGRRQFVESLSQGLRQSGNSVDRRQLELVATGLMDRVHIDGEFDEFSIGDVVPYSRVERLYRARKDAIDDRPNRSVGRYLEEPALHYTVGTRVTPTVQKRLESMGVESVKTHADPAPFSPKVVRGMDLLHTDPDWMVRFAGSGLQKGLQNAAMFGSESDENSTSFVPSRAKAINFGRLPLQTGDKAN